ncbi:putative Mce family protein [Gordonia spumicola]|uniref:Putative Mce family protein n=1 Tax=Gordonia spumicola TaxID=589161 RepID=A0A7I9V6T6_9ACTN|nr:MlaD family protein [Gordonia spumicola]GEE00902.1 putative Mce family protein [Gordonia spumicola]
MMKLSPLVAIKATLFMALGLIAAVLVFNTLQVPVSGPTDEYTLEFTDAEGVIAGNPVKMSGVRVGRVESVDFAAQPDGTSIARVRIEVQRAHPVPDRVHAAIRYGDMLGARYIALSDGGADAPPRRGDVITVASTTGPVDLSALMNGFQPLFNALDPTQVNDLAQGFVDTFEGRRSSVDLLLRQIATMGSNLSANSAVFARLVSNLNTLMLTVDQRTPQLTELFTGLNRLTSAVIGDGGQLARLLDSGDRAVAALAQMMTTAGDSFVDSLTGLRRMTAAWIPQTRKFETFLSTFPGLADKINHSGRYGGFMMLYLCNFTLKASPVEANIFGPLHSPVCR